VERITSRHNPLVHAFRAAARDAETSLLLDGAHLIGEALAAGVAIDVVAARERSSTQDTGELLRRAGARGARLVTVTDAVLEAMSPVRQPSGIVAIARRPSATLDTTLAGRVPFVLVLVSVQDPGNVGAIVRVADACGATGIVAAQGTADPFQWKALRGSMGSAFRLPVAHGEPLARVMAAVRARGLRLVAAVPRDGTPLPCCDLRAAVAVAFGSEGGGLPDEVIAAADERLTVPMRAPVESLNVAAAAAIVAYEAERQRQEIPHDQVALRGR
jgi:RNA methyltransferase, TrmH family